MHSCFSRRERKKNFVNYCGDVNRRNIKISRRAAIVIAREEDFSREMLFSFFSKLLPLEKKIYKHHGSRYKLKHICNTARISFVITQSVHLILTHAVNPISFQHLSAVFLGQRGLLNNKLLHCGGSARSCTAVESFIRAAAAGFGSRLRGKLFCTISAAVTSLLN